MKLNINTILLNTLYVLLEQGETNEALRILRDIRSYQLLRYKAREEYQKGNKTQYKAFNEEIEAFVKEHDLKQFMD